MDSDYFSLTSIMAENHKLPCTFTLDVPGLGYLESNTDADLHAGAKVELPMWLGPTLCVNDLATCAIPQPYSTRVRAALKASAPAVRLSGLVGAGGFWYRFGAQLANILENGDTYYQMLLTAFKNRLPPLQDLAAHNASGETYSLPEHGPGTGESFREGMEADERELFNIGQESAKLVKTWYDSIWGKKSFGW